MNFNSIDLILSDDEFMISYSYDFSNSRQGKKPVAKNSVSMPPTSACSYKRQRSISFTQGAGSGDKYTSEGTQGSLVSLREDSED